MCASAKCRLLFLGYVSYAAVVSLAGSAVLCTLVLLSLSAAAAAAVAWGTFDGVCRTLPVAGGIRPEAGHIMGRRWDCVRTPHRASNAKPTWTTGVYKSLGGEARTHENDY